MRCLFIDIQPTSSPATTLSAQKGGVHFRVFGVLRGFRVCMGFGFWVFRLHGFRLGLGLRVSGSGSRVQGLGCRAQ